MPNWCHNTLTVSCEDAAQLERFTSQAKDDEQPLSFARHVPEPTDDEYAAIDESNEADCWLCGGRGKRPRTAEEAETLGVAFHEGVVPTDISWDDLAKCNCCGGLGKCLPAGMSGSWYEWRSSNWGCKWDASFGEPFIAIGSQEMDVETTAESQGVTLTPTVAIYKFDTPWSPPVPYVEAVSAQHPELEFTLTFAEVGNGYAGRLRYVSGCMMEEVDLDVEEVLMPEEMWF